MKLTENALAVLRCRYLIRDEKGNLLETPEQLFRRVADAIAAPETQFDPAADTAALSRDFYCLMTSLAFLPNSPTLMNAGKPRGQLSACFVLPVEDSLESIFEAIKQAALIHQSGGGTGFSFSRLRPAGSPVRSSGGVASGPVSFMRVFNAATEAVKQGGARRGANMGVLRVDHPDILEFIHCKRDPAAMTNFNISVGLTDAFMRALAAGEMYDLIAPQDGRVVGRLAADTVFSLLTEAAWQNGEPGVLFLDRINRDNPVPSTGALEATNPCGEQPLLPYESCNLGSVNLAAMTLSGARGVDWDRLARTVRLAVHFLDNVISAGCYPLEQIRTRTESARKIGLGVMGLHDLLLALRLPYDSDEAVELGGRLMAFIHNTASAASAALAEQRGVFPLCGSPLALGGRRNATVTTVAPTGTLSLLAGVSSGIEPVFAWSYTRHVLDGSVLTEHHPLLEAALRENGVSAKEDLPPDVARVFVCAHDIAPSWHIKMQAAFQRHVDNAVSKTVNFPHGATREDVRESFLLAYKLGCKGITVYRDGSRDGQVLQAAAPRQPEGEDDVPCLDCARPGGGARCPVLSPQENGSEDSCARQTGGGQSLPSPLRKEGSHDLP